MHQVYNDLLQFIVKLHNKEVFESNFEDNNEEVNMILFKNLALICTSYCLYLDAYELNKQILKNNKKRIHNHPEYQSLNENNNKSYTLVLDMDETLIHYFDVRLIII